MSHVPGDGVPVCVAQFAPGRDSAANLETMAAQTRAAAVRRGICATAIGDLRRGCEELRAEVEA